MKKRAAFLLALLFCVIVIFSSCSRFEPQTIKIIDKLSDNSAFRIVTQNPTWSFGGFFTFVTNENHFVGKRIFRLDELKSDSYIIDEGLLENAENQLKALLKISDDEFSETYGSVKCVKYYKDFTVFIANTQPSGDHLHVFKVVGKEYEHVEFLKHSSSGTGDRYYYRVGDKLHISVNNYVLDLKDLTLEKGELEAPENNTEALIEKGFGLVKATASLSGVYEKISDWRSLTATELDGKFWFAVTQNFEYNAELYCFIFDAATGEALYAAHMTTPPQKDLQLGGSFVLAQPVMENGYWFYNLI